MTTTSQTAPGTRSAVRTLTLDPSDRPFIVIWEVTRACQLVCKHCRADSQPVAHPEQLTTEQGKGRTVFHLFERGSLEHAGAVTGPTVANTDGIWLDPAPSATFPDGVLYAVHDDQGAVAFDWGAIATALELPACPR